MQKKDLQKPIAGMNTDDNPAVMPPGDYPDALNMRVSSSNEQHGVGVAETLQGEIELLLGVSAQVTYYGGAIGAEFIYDGFDEVKIGDQVWMKSNWAAKYPGSKVYDDDEENRAIYGGLYSWYQAMSSDFAPEGWHLPTEAEVDELLAYLGGSVIAGELLKEYGTDHWLSPNAGTNESGFRALPGGQLNAAFELLREIGSFWTATELGALKDKDGNSYTSIIIGDKEWIVENLRTTTYSNGAPILNAINPVDLEDTDGAYAYYDNDSDNGPIYGCLYNFYAVENAHGLVYFERDGIRENGWRVPTIEEYLELIELAGGMYYAGGQLKEKGTEHWLTPNSMAVDSYRFKARGAGIYHRFDGFILLRQSLFLLTSSINETFPDNVHYVTLGYNWGGVFNFDGAGKGTAMSIRCVRDVVADMFIDIIYGYLYNSYAATDPRYIAADGWHVPEFAEMEVLVTFLGGYALAGGLLKETGTEYWTDPNTGATNAVGFNGRGGGDRTEYDGSFASFHSYGSFHLSDQPAFNIRNNVANVGQWAAVANWQRQGFSIRLVKDSTTLSDGQTGTYTGNDGKIYRTKCIGTQEWLADNLAETKYRNGDNIDHVTDDATWAALNTGARCAFDNDENNVLR